MSDTSGKEARQYRRLSEIWFDILPFAGVKQQAADQLSKLQTVGNDETNLDEEILV